MPRVAPFQALVYDPAVAGPLERVTAPPYDVISDARRREYLADPYNIVHVDLADGPETGPGNRYDRAADLLDRWVREGALRGLGDASYFAYEMRVSAPSGQRSILGLLCAMTLKQWGAGVVPHERTMPGPVGDRLRLLRATGTHLSAVYGTITGPCGPLAEFLSAAAREEPVLEMTDGQSVLHRVWSIPADTPISGLIENELVLIADGHHRYTTALHYARERRAKDGPGPWDRILSFIVDAGTEELSVLPFHRIQLRGDPPAAGEHVSDLATTLARVSDDEPSVGIVTRRRGGIEFRVWALAGAPPAVRALHEELLDGNEFDAGLRFTPDPGVAIDAVRSGEAVAAYLLPVTTTERIRAVVERGDRLPQKSTYFWPKPRTGLVMMPLEQPPSPMR